MGDGKRRPYGLLPYPSWRILSRPGSDWAGEVVAEKHGPAVSAEEIITADDIEAKSRELALMLNQASDQGLSPALILPRMVMVFREVFGELPPQLMALLGGMQQ